MRLKSASNDLSKASSICRVCGGDFYAQPLLQYSNMPAAAQHFPSAETLAQDKGNNLEVCQCSICGLIQLSNTPVTYYRDVIRAAAFSESMREFRLAQFKAWATEHHLIGQKVLEVGCGKGEYLSLLKVAGVDAYGIEHAAEAIEICQEQGLAVSQAYLGDDNQTIPHSPFAGFVCLNFMEHWPDPNASLQALTAHLADGAIGLVEVPNFDMILQQGLFSEFIADHLLYFTQATLTFTLQLNGFEVLECKPVWQDYILSAVVRKRKPTNLAFFDEFRHNISSQLHAFIDRFDPQQVAIWGAGHQALAIISLADLSQKIAYVVDSASFKQGKFTPATHLPVVAPSHLNAQPVAAVIVMAASYSDEVVNILKTQFNQQLKIAVLRSDRLEEI